LWLPQETIFFDGASLVRETEVALDPSARLVACESVIFGRAAMGETVRAGAIVESWRIRVAGRLVFADSLRLSGDIAGTLDRPAVGGGARALATVIYAGAGADERIELLRAAALGFDSARVASSCLGPVVVTRIMANTGQAARRALSAVLSALIGSLSDDAIWNRLPRVWSC
jgi:urease accessory protein